MLKNFEKIIYAFFLAVLTGMPVFPVVLSRKPKFWFWHQLSFTSLLNPYLKHDEEVHWWPTAQVGRCVLSSACSALSSCLPPPSVARANLRALSRQFLDTPKHRYNLYHLFALLFPVLGGCMIQLYLAKSCYFVTTLAVWCLLPCFRPKNSSNCLGLLSVKEGEAMVCLLLCLITS